MTKKNKKKQKKKKRKKEQNKEKEKPTSNFEIWPYFRPRPTVSVARPFALAAKSGAVLGLRHFGHEITWTWLPIDEYAYRIHDPKYT